MMNLDDFRPKEFVSNRHQDLHKMNDKLERMEKDIEIKEHALNSKIKDNSLKLTNLKDKLDITQINMINNDALRWNYSLTDEELKIKKLVDSKQIDGLTEDEIKAASKFKQMNKKDWETKVRKELTIEDVEDNRRIEKSLKADEDLLRKDIIGLKTGKRWLQRCYDIELAVLRG